MFECCGLVILKKSSRVSSRQRQQATLYGLTRSEIRPSASNVSRAFVLDAPNGSSPPSASIRGRKCWAVNKWPLRPDAATAMPPMHRAACRPYSRSQGKRHAGDKPAPAINASLPAASLGAIRRSKWIVDEVTPLVRPQAARGTITF